MWWRHVSFPAAVSRRPRARLWCVGMLVRTRWHIGAGFPLFEQERYFIYMPLTERNPWSLPVYLFTSGCARVSAAPYCSLTHTLKNGGVFNRTTGALGSKVHYFCKPGHRMIGHSNATCQRSPGGMYQWDSLAPLCQGKKGAFTSPNLNSVHCCYLNHILRTTAAAVMDKGKEKLNVGL